VIKTADHFSLSKAYPFSSRYVTIPAQQQNKQGACSNVAHMSNKSEEQHNEVRNTFVLDQFV
jgi:hypothetical protein